MQKGLSGYCFMYIDRPFCLQTEHLAIIVIHRRERNPFHSNQEIHSSSFSLWKSLQHLTIHSNWTKPLGLSCQNTGDITSTCEKFQFICMYVLACTLYCTQNVLLFSCLYFPHRDPCHNSMYGTKCCVYLIAGLVCEKITAIYSDKWREILTKQLCLILKEITQWAKDCGLLRQVVS